MKGVPNRLVPCRKSCIRPNVYPAFASPRFYGIFTFAKIQFDINIVAFVREQECNDTYRQVNTLYWVPQKLLQINTVIAYICIGKVA